MKKIYPWLLLSLLCIGTLCADAPVPASPHDMALAPAEQDNQFFSAFLNTMILLAITLIVIFIATRFLKQLANTRIQQVNSSSLIKIVEKRTLSPRSTLYLLNLSGKEIVIAESHTGISTIAELPMRKESPVGDNFSKLLLPKEDQ